MMRGRGKSRGAAGLTRPHARDDDGKVISIPQGFDGPPPLYPPCDLPDPLPKESFLEVEPIVRTLHLMNSRYRNSPFHPIRTDDPTGGSLGTSRRRKSAVQRNDLMSVLTLHPNNIPPELYTEKQRALGGTAAAQAAFWASAADVNMRHRDAMHDISIDIGRLEELEEREMKGEPAAPWVGQSNGALGNGAIGIDVEEEMAREEAEAADEAELEGMGDDDGLGDNDIDPYEVYDDDDEGGYDDDDGDGGEAWM